MPYIIHNRPHSPDEKNENIQRGQVDIDDETQKVAVIIIPDTIVNPRTVVVHLEHTATTSATMMRSRRLENIARFAEPWSGDSHPLGFL